MNKIQLIFFLYGVFLLNATGSMKHTPLVTRTVTNSKNTNSVSCVWI